MARLARRQLLRIAASAAVLPSLNCIAAAQTYPSRPITVIVPTGAGGPQDLVARILVERVRATLGQPLIVENVPGANGTIGIGRVARAKGDGYTLAFSVSFATHVLNPAVYALPYDVVADFEPIALVTHAPQVILSKKAVPADDIKGLIAWLKANPDKASLGHTGPGSPAHVVGTLFQKLTGTRFAFVTYRTAGQAMQDMIAGHIDLMFTDPNIALEHVRAGSIKAYAVTAEQRLDAAPEIPSVAEAGLPGYLSSAWFAFWAPKRTPSDVIATLNGAVVDALADPVLRKRFADLGQQVFPREQQTPAALAAFHKAEIAKWWPIIKEAGIKAE